MKQVIEDYLTNQVDKVSLSQVTDCFKGKAVSKTSDEGNIAVINLSDMTDTGIDYAKLKKIEANQRTMLRYLLQDGDVLVASKGTVKKVEVFHSQTYDVVASANITVLRPRQDLLGAYIKLFLDSKLGHALLDQANTGKSVMNINREKLLTIEIPNIPLVKQNYLVQRYYQGLQDYKRKVSRAEQEWQRIRAEVEKGLF